MSGRALLNSAESIKDRANALLNALEFVKSNFEVEAERNYIMQAGGAPPARCLPWCL